MKFICVRCYALRLLRLKSPSPPLLLFPKCSGGLASFAPGSDSFDLVDEISTDTAKARQMQEEIKHFHFLFSSPFENSIARMMFSNSPFEMKRRNLLPNSISQMIVF